MSLFSSTFAMARNCALIRLISEATCPAQLQGTGVTVPALFPFLLPPQFYNFFLYWNCTNASCAREQAAIAWNGCPHLSSLMAYLRLDDSGTHRWTQTHSGPTLSTSTSPIHTTRTRVPKERAPDKRQNYHHSKARLTLPCQRRQRIIVRCRDSHLSRSVLVALHWEIFSRLLPSTQV